MCVACYEDDFDTDCEFCGDIVCTLCCSSRGRCAAPGCVELNCCDACWTKHGAYFKRCGDCGRQFCENHTEVCTRCNIVDAGCPQVGESFCSRALMQCCSCKRFYCADCDKGPDTEAGVRGVYDPGCVFCCSRPEACTGVADDAAEVDAQDERDARAWRSYGVHDGS